MKKGRLEAFSDGSSRSDHHHGVRPEGPGRVGLARFGSRCCPSRRTYVLSFVYLGIYWNNHHHMLQVTERVNGTVLWANLHLLFWLSLMPFVTSWLRASEFAALRGSLMDLPSVRAPSHFICSTRSFARNGPHSPLREAIGADVKGRFFDWRLRSGNRHGVPGTDSGDQLLRDCRHRLAHSGPAKSSDSTSTRPR